MVAQHHKKRTRQPVRSMTACEQAWVARARSGEQSMRDIIVLSLQGKIERMASHFLQGSFLQMQGFEQEDLVQSANEAMLLHFSQALAEDKTNPIAYLLQVAKLTMYDFFNGRHNTIQTDPNCCKPIVLLSLDMPLRGSEEEEHQTMADTFPTEIHLSPSLEDAYYDVLLQAVEALPTKQRNIIKRHYGLEEFAPESLMSIARELSPHTASRPKTAHYHHKQAIGKLQATLQQCCFPSGRGGR